MSDKSMKTEKALPVILRQEVVAQSRLFRVEALQLRFSNGEERVYERIPGGNRHAVMIVPVLNNDTLLLIREYAAGTHTYELGFPKGLVDAGETDEEAANRELQEEIGMAAGALTFMKQVSLAPGFMNAKMAIFMAHDLYPQQLAGDEPEELEVVPWPLHDAEALLDHPQFHEARSVAALLLFLRQSRQESPSAQQD
ncbi:MAG: ADP compounds hydrolase NudE [Tolumonas sp.]|jgi:ADP-ribose diphosphatase|nr:ADP compounds hydrolase NudE [Tolumonas sp.]TXH65857.1 MAG: ADP compounds hydrolase NudE [Tolumonas sp.]